MGHKETEILDLIIAFKKLDPSDAISSTESIDKFVEEVRLQSVSTAIKKSMLSYIIFETLFGEVTTNSNSSNSEESSSKSDEKTEVKGTGTESEETTSKLSGEEESEAVTTSSTNNLSLNVKNLKKYGELFKKLITEIKIPVGDMFWGLELYVAEHENVLKGTPQICKVLYDLDLIDEANFLPYYKDSDKNKENPGHSSVHKIIRPFADWLEQDSSDDDDSD